MKNALCMNRVVPPSCLNMISSISVIPPPCMIFGPCLSLCELACKVRTLAINISWRVPPARAEPMKLSSP